MIRKFECKECHHQFEADDQQWVECPKCHSDNVAEAKKGIAVSEMPEWVGKVVLGVIAVALLGCGGYFGWKFFGGSLNDEPTETVTLEIPATRDEFTKQADEDFAADGGKNATTISIEDQVYNDATRTYKLRADVRYAPADDWKVQICELGTTKVVKEGTNRQIEFDGIPASSDIGGRYTFRVVRTSDGSEICAIDVGGLSVQKKIAKAWTAAELERAINDPKKAMAEISDYITDDCRVVVTGQYEKEAGAFDSVDKVHRHIKNNKEVTGANAKVEKVEAGPDNRITMAQIRISENVKKTAEPYEF